jgi:glucose/galactose transporter
MYPLFYGILNQRKMSKSSRNTAGAGLMNKRDMSVSILIMAILFFVIGFISWVNSILIPYFKVSFELSNFRAYLVTFAFYISYLLISIPSSFLLKRIGFRKGIMAAFLLMAAGAFLFVPAAMTKTYGIFLFGLFALGAGLAILQTAANPYVTILGPREKAVQRFSIMGVCNKGAGILAPLIFARVILRPTDTALFRQLTTMDAAEKSRALEELIQRVILPYAAVGVILLVLGLIVRLSPLPEIDTEHETPDVAMANSGKKNIFQFPHLILAALAIFLHVGTQVIAIDTVIGYAGSMHILLPEAKVFPSYTLTATIIGYLLGILLVPRHLSQLRAFRLCTLTGLLFTLLIFLARGQVSLLGHHTDISIWFVVLLGLPNSLIYAGIWPLALDGLGRFTKLGSSVLIMGLCGNALLPLIYGYFADRYSLHQAYWVLLPCYLYLIFYAFYGFSIRKWRFRKLPAPEAISPKSKEYENIAD